MALIIWNENLSVDISVIDRQHQQLVDMINDLHNAMLQGKGQHILGKILNGLNDYTAEHFATEEKLFAQFNYPETADHIREHAHFINKLNEFKAIHTKGSEGTSIELIDFLSNWLATHILEVDRRYAPFLRDNGVE